MKLIGFGSGPLFKFCPSEFNLVEGCNTLRVGTLWGFREEENELLKDEGEGKFEFKISFPELTPVSQSWISEFEVDTGGSAHIGQMQFNNGAISVKDVSLEGSAHNIWIFCVSMGSEAAGNISQAHESKWKIPSNNVEEFGNYIGRLLWENISVDDLPADLLKQHSLQKIHAGLGLQVEMRQVEYTDREIEISSENDYPAERVKHLKESIPFLKPKRFREEQEFRFAFSLTFAGQKISINDKPKILQLRPIDNFVSKE